MIYAVFQMTLTDPTKLAAYRERAGAALARHGGAVVTATPEPTTLEGSRPLPDVMALLSFETRDGALAWINDHDLAELHALRNSAGDSSIKLIG